MPVENSVKKVLEDPENIFSLSWTLSSDDCSNGNACSISLGWSVMGS